MTSEMGAATPYIMTDAEYTPEELEHQPKTLISAKWFNGGASCNGPQNVLGFQKAYPNDSKVIFNAGSKQTESSIDEAHLPLLVVSITVNLSSPEGQSKASKEYALHNEAFLPVLVLVTMDDNDFLSAAVNLSNQYMYGTLSCSLAVPSSVTNSSKIAKAIQDLKYGAIVTNGWAGHAYLTWSLGWGGIHGEHLDSVESGIGKVINCMMFDKIEKCVLKTPCVTPMHFHFCMSREEQAGAHKFVSHLVMGLDPALIGTMS